MNNLHYQEAVKSAVKPAFHGKESLKSKTTPIYPNSAEREFRRITGAYMKLLHSSLKEHLPEIMQAYKLERHGPSRMDDARDLEREVRAIIMKIAQEIEKKMAAYDLGGLIRRIAGITKDSAKRQWKRSVHNTLGIDLMDDYYSGDFYEEAIRRWVDMNVVKIQSIPNETLGEMREIILTGFKEGRTIRDLTHDIQEEYNVTKRKAQYLARDQIATLNAQITKLQQQDAGCNRYRWSTSRDSRVRECHRALDGQTFSWDDPPEMWYRTKKAGLVKTGRRCHPGEDYACRCVAIPVFDIETLNIPMKQKSSSKGQST